jgi:hypothetical protein
MGGCLTRLAWLVVAPIALLLVGGSIARDGSGPWSIESLLFWAVVVAAVAIRYVDVVRMQGETVKGNPASREDWRRYSVKLSVVALALWSAAVWLA